MSKWKPIETAPCNERVLIYGAELDEMVMAWKDVCDLNWYYAPNGGALIRSGKLGYWNPTHWKPLPPPPK